MSRRFQWITLIAALLVLDVLFVAIDRHFGFPLMTDALGVIERHFIP